MHVLESRKRRQNGDFLWSFSKMVTILQIKKWNCAKETDVLDHETAGNWAFLPSMAGFWPRIQGLWLVLPLVPFSSGLIPLIYHPPLGQKQPTAVGRYNKEQFKWPRGKKIKKKTTLHIFIVLDIALQWVCRKPWYKYSTNKKLQRAHSL